MGQGYMHLSAAEREEISCGIALGWSWAIARLKRPDKTALSNGVWV